MVRSQELDRTRGENVRRTTGVSASAGNCRLRVSSLSCNCFRNASLENYQVDQYFAKSLKLLDEQDRSIPEENDLPITFNDTPKPRPDGLESEVQEIFRRNVMFLEAAPAGYDMPVPKVPNQ